PRGRLQSMVRELHLEAAEDGASRGHLVDQRIEPVDEESSSSGASQRISTASLETTRAGSVSTAVSASAACANASSRVAPMPRTPTSAPWGKCSQAMAFVHSTPQDRHDLVVVDLGEPAITLADGEALHRCIEAGELVGVRSYPLDSLTRADRDGANEMLWSFRGDRMQRGDHRRARRETVVDDDRNPTGRLEGGSCGRVLGTAAAHGLELHGHFAFDVFVRRAARFR